MVKIFKHGKQSMEVSRSAFENFYKNAGWNIKEGDHVSKTSKKDKKDKADREDPNDSWEGYEEDLDIPLSDMNIDELRERAVSLGIDLAGLNTPKQIRDRIRKVTG